MKLIDIHAHYGGWINLPNPYTSIEDLLETCRRYDIERCILSSVLAISYDIVEGNERLRQVIDGHDTLRGYVTIHPGYPRESMALLQEYLQLPNFVGAKIHPKHAGYHVDCPEARPLMEYLAELGKPVLAHTWYVEMCQAMADLADALPDLTLIMGHMGGDDWECALKMAASRPNLYLELVAGLAPWGKIERSIEAVGVERILFGSDLTLLDPAYTIGTVTGAEISDEDKQKILYDNAKALFGF
jgi:uncharacterized protein